MNDDRDPMLPVSIWWLLAPLPGVVLFALLVGALVLAEKGALLVCLPAR